MATIREQWEDFHQKHPEVYREFCRRADQLWSRGIRHYSADGILHIIRFHSVIDGRPDQEWKINNNHAAFYGRLYAQDHPDRAAFFAQRKQKFINNPKP